MKKFLVVIMTLALATGLFACSNSGNGSGEADDTSSSGESQTIVNVEGDSEAMDVIATVENDGDATIITGEAYNDYFYGDAASSVPQLLNEGKFYVNGIQVPVDDTVTEDYQVNGVSSIYKTDSGWGYNVHKTTSADNLSFEDARLGFIETISTVRGHRVTVYGDSQTGLVNKVDCESFEVFRITYFENHGGQVDKIERGDFELETERIRVDVETVTVNSDDFDENIQVGDIVYYYYSPDGWVMNKAESMNGTLSKDEEGNFVLNNGEYVKIESNVSRYNLINSNRPTQFFTAYNNLSLTDVSVVMWVTPTGHPITFTYGDKESAKAALNEAITHAEEAEQNVLVSVDGSDVAKGVMWTTQADRDTFDAAIETAKSVANSNGTAVYEYDQAIYNLSQALGESGEKPSGFLGAQGEGSME